MDVYRPQGALDRPAVIVVNGSSGVHSRIRNTATEYAKALAEQGLYAFVVHYFDSTHTIIASRSSENRHYFTWVGVLRDAVTWVSRFPGVDSTSIGMMGHSLGAFLAVGAAATDPRVRRIVLFGGALEPFLEGGIGRMPPALLCHGDKDDEVPLSDAQHLVDVLKKQDDGVDLIVYPGEGHTFSDSIACAALSAAARFLTPDLSRAGGP